MIVATNAFLQACINALKANPAAVGPLDGTKIGLFTAVAGGLTPDTVIADLTLATYTGYAAQAMTWSAVFADPDGSFATDSGLHVFQPTDAVTPNVVSGYHVTNTAGTVLLFAEMFAAPISLPNAFSAVRIVAHVELPDIDESAGTVIQ